MNEVWFFTDIQRFQLIKVPDAVSKTWWPFAGQGLGGGGRTKLASLGKLHSLMDPGK